jgi:hypothetical protein
MNFKVTFNLDGTGINYNEFEPIHLDALLCAIAAQDHPNFNPSLSRDEKPDDIFIPLQRSLINKSFVWHASALFPEDVDVPETLRYWRKRFRTERAHLTTGAPNLMRGVYRSYNMPMTPKLLHRLSAYFSGNIEKTEKLLKRITGIGHKRGWGYGRVLSYKIQETPDDHSLINCGVAMRYLPHPQGTKLVRPMPPYWNSFGRVKCRNVGEKYVA